MHSGAKAPDSLSKSGKEWESRVERGAENYLAPAWTEPAMKYRPGFKSQLQDLLPDDLD